MKRKSLKFLSVLLSVSMILTPVSSTFAESLENAEQTAVVATVSEEESEEVSVTPAAEETPAVTEAPEVTETPETTETPVVTETPETTEKVTDETESEEEQVAAEETVEKEEVTVNEETSTVEETTETPVEEKEIVVEAEKTLSTALADVDDASLTTAVVNNSTNIKDGTYTPDNTTICSSEKISITCDSVQISGGKALANIKFSSPRYLYMKANAQTYTGTVGDSTVEYNNIPVQLGTEYSIYAYTSAMGGKWVNYSITVSVTAEENNDSIDDSTETKVESEYVADEAGETVAVNNATAFADGNYNTDSFTFGGGSGKTTISCQKVIVSGGKSYAVIEISSDKYTNLKASGNTYTGTCENGTSVYTIPVQLGVDNTVIGKTTAMSTEKWITYTINASISESGLIVEATPTPEPTATPTPTPVPETEETYPDGDYGIEIESDFKMFTVKNATAVVKDGKIVVTLTTDNTSYDRLYLGSIEDADKSSAITGTAGTSADDYAYAFVFELDKSMMGQTINFVPGNSEKGTWYEKAQKTLKIPTVLDYADGDYDIAIESDFKMFTVKTATAVVADKKIVVTLTTDNTSYDRIYLGNLEDEDKSSAIIGTAGGETDDYAYVFVFELDKNLMGQTINFVPGNSEKDTWYEKAQKTLKIPLAMTKVEADDEEDNDSEDTETTTTLDNGNYTVDVDVNGTMFNVINSILTVKDGAYSAEITLSGTGYDKLFIGTAEEAAKADESQYIGYTTDAEGKYVFTIPVAALDTEIAVAAHAVKSDTWKDRGLTFKSETAEKVAVTVGNGDYTVTVNTTTGKMFNVVAAVLTNTDAGMTAKITLSGTGYDYLYIGTPEAALTDKDNWITYTENESGQYVFEIPVTALDEEIMLAAHSSKNDTWYERGITFDSSTLVLVEGAGTTTTPTPTPTPVPDTKPEEESKYESDLSGGTSAVDSSTGLADGVYTPDSFSWSGGSGRTSITCSKVTVTGGKAYATIVFGSTTYGYVKANGNKYFPSYGAGTSSFTIPVKLNANNTIIGMTTAMSAAHEITYTIYIYIAGADNKSGTSSTTVDKDNLSDEAPEIIGLEYTDEAIIEHAKYFKIYYYDQDITLIEVDMATDTDKPVAEEEEITEEAVEEEEIVIETSEEGETTEVKDTTTEISELYQNNVVRYLLVPEDVEVPVGLEKDMIIINMPVESVYTDSKQALETFEKLELKEELVTVENEEPATKPEYKELILNKCDFAILSDDFLWDEEKEDITIDEQSELLYEITERLTTLGIPAIVDRSADEASDEATAEWIKVYGEIFGCETLAESLYQEAIK